MPEHRLPKGRLFFQGLTQLGQALGYHVEAEHSIESKPFNPQAVDVAWFAARHQRFPLFIFEIESRSTNAMANNATKVFGKTRSNFEKPLFFFHIVISGGEASNRIADLRGSFGRFNYDIYRISMGEIDRLILDIISQHVRIRDSIDIVALAEILTGEPWAKVDRQQLLEHVETLGFSRTSRDILPAYAQISIHDKYYQSQFIRYLHELSKGRTFSHIQANFETYLGTQWPEPIFIGILSPSEYRNPCISYTQLLTDFQTSSSFPSTIGPYFGLEMDYDEFILGVAAAYFALVASLMRDEVGAVRYICEQIKLILVSLEDTRNEYSYITAS
jgi:hypothetical protein